ncbi:MAG: DUF1761 domain-containing protein [Fidelibacterota bacterium]
MANFIFGYLWYTPLFGRAWAREMGFDPEQKTPGSEMARGMIFTVIGNPRKSWKLFGINTGHHFAALLIAAVILVTL